MVSTVSSDLVGVAFTRAPSTPRTSEPILRRPSNYRSDPRNQRPNIATAGASTDDRFYPRGCIGKKSAPQLLCEGRRIAGGTDGTAAAVRSADKPPSQRWEVGRVICPPTTTTDHVTVATRRSADSARDGQDTKREYRPMDVRGTSLFVQLHAKTSQDTNASRKRSKTQGTTGGSPVSVLSPSQAKSSLDSAVSPKETGHRCIQGCIT